MVPVSYEFIDIKGLEFEKEDFIMNQKRIQGKCDCFRAAKYFKPSGNKINTF
jgi:hypothetical protein